MNRKICIVGLGYVGLPLAVAFGKRFPITGFDINEKKISELKSGLDSTGEVLNEQITESNIEYSNDPKCISKADFIIIAVPTPITNAKEPDLQYVISASEIVGKDMKKGSIIVYESTVYPGTTEEICVPILEKESGLKYIIDFKVGYSPERINPGDKEHTVERIVKVVSGCDEQSLKIISEVYSTIVDAGVHEATSIKVAEAGKVIENIQRDLNIALMNELSLIFDKMDISTKDVIDAASTKWNFHKYYPGLVGGHCIGVDPYYLTFKAQQLGYEPQIILAGRNINENMSKHVAELVLRGLSQKNKAVDKCNVLIMGLTFKENVADYRNSKAKDVIDELKKSNMNVIGCDPMIDKKIIKKHFRCNSVEINEIRNVDCVVILAPHEKFQSYTIEKYKEIMGKNPVLIDVKNHYPRDEFERAGFIYMSL